MIKQSKLVSAEYLRRRIRETLRAQGYNITRQSISLTVNDKEALRRTHSLAVQSEIHRAQKALSPYEERLLGYIANGNEVVPEQIHPILIMVRPDTEYSLLFRYASLHWSIPISNGYGRRLRFIVLDENNEKLIGILGLSDPIFSLRARDNWIGWDFEQRKANLFNVMDAYVLGAVPPYSRLLCGKLIAMAAVSREIVEAFHERYDGRETVLRHRVRPANLALVTTTSALGRSSIYNRVMHHKRLLFDSVGYTSGWGTFHFANGVYEKMFAFANEYCDGTAKANGWGGGKFRNRQEVIRKTLQYLDFPEDWMLHQVQREIFVAPLASNTRQFLQGETNDLHYWARQLRTYFRFFKKRWLLPRAERNSTYLNFNREEWRLWRT